MPMDRRGFLKQSAFALAAGTLPDAIAMPLPAPVAAQAVGHPAKDDDVPRIVLWPGGIAPRSRGIAVAQRIVERSADPASPDRYIDGVTAPYLAVYAPRRPNGRALLVLPGGGYQRIVLDKEGSALVPAFVERAGDTLFVLRYRLPGDGHAEGADAPLADAQRAMRLIRAQAARWRIDPDRVGVMGFSAGGHLAASLATRYRERIGAPVDAADVLEVRPDFVLLAYPVVSMREGLAHAGSRQRLLGAAPSTEAQARHSPDLHVDAGVPPVFLLHAQDDDVVPVGNSLALHAALLEAGVPSELHVFAHGGHGFGVRGATGPLAIWPTLAHDWMRSLGK